MAHRLPLDGKCILVGTSQRPLQNGPKAIPPSEVLPSGLSPHAPSRYSSHRADVHRLNCQEASS
jgi:hypothetical protein